VIIPQSKIQLGLPQLPDGVPKELYFQFATLYTAMQSLAAAVSLYAGVDPQPQDVWSQLALDSTIFDGNLARWYVKANEAINFGQAVSPVIGGDGTLQVRLANATDNTRFCCGFSNTVGTTPIGSFLEVLPRGYITGVSGMNAGQRYFLSTTSGVITNAAPVAAGNIEQVLGWAMSSTRLFANPNSAFIQH
jgi:hypothetical protein